MPHFNKLITLLSFLLIFAGSNASAKQWRLATSYKPQTEGHLDIVSFTEKIKARSNGRITIRIYPADQLGDWVEVHEQVMEGAVEMTMDAVPSTFDSRLVVMTFPYAVTDYATVKKAYTPGGYMYKIVDEILTGKGIKILSSWAHGFGGGAFTKPVPNPTDPDTHRKMKIRVWPGAIPHRALMERLGFIVTMVPWAEVYTALQTGVASGVIGTNPELTLNHFKDITKMYIHYSDYFGIKFFMINKTLWDSLPEADKAIVQGAAVEAMNDRLLKAQQSDAVHLQLLREAGIEVITFDADTLNQFAHITRRDVWPKVKDQIGDVLFERLNKQLNAAQNSSLE